MLFKIDLDSYMYVYKDMKIELEQIPKPIDTIDINKDERIIRQRAGWLD